MRTPEQIREIAKQWYSWTGEEPSPKVQLSDRWRATAEICERLDRLIELLGPEKDVVTWMNQYEGRGSDER